MVLRETDISEKNIASIFGIEQHAEEEARRSRGANSAKLDACSYWFLTRLALRPRRRKLYISPKRWALSELHGITTQKFAV
jgi:hypothetical protein